MIIDASDKSNSDWKYAYLVRAIIYVVMFVFLAITIYVGINGRIAYYQKSRVDGADVALNVFCVVFGSVGILALHIVAINYWYHVLTNDNYAKPNDVIIQSLKYIAYVFCITLLMCVSFAIFHTVGIASMLFFNIGYYDRVYDGEIINENWNFWTNTLCLNIDVLTLLFGVVIVTACVIGLLIVISIIGFICWTIQYAYTNCMCCSCNSYVRLNTGKTGIESINSVGYGSMDINNSDIVPNNSDPSKIFRQTYFK